MFIDCLTLWAELLVTILLATIVAVACLGGCILILLAVYSAWKAVLVILALVFVPSTVCWLYKKYF